MATILVAEDDEHIRLLITQRLKKQFTVLTAGDGQEALEVIREQPVDLLVADVMMPRMDGFELVRNLREQGFTLPILMITANLSFDSKKTGFSSGVDDYLTKPIEYEELMWRIQALLRRARIFTDQKIRIGEVLLDSRDYTLCRGELRLELPRKEFDLLFKLLSFPGRIFTKDQIMQDVWGRFSESGEETVKTHISRLRTRLKDIDEFALVAVKGIGYKAEIPGEQG